MRRVLLLLLAIAPLVLLACGGKSQSADEEVRGVVEAYFEAANDGDIDTMWSSYCDSLKAELTEVEVRNALAQTHHDGYSFGDLELEDVVATDGRAMLKGHVTLTRGRLGASRMVLFDALSRERGRWCFSDMSSFAEGRTPATALEVMARDLKFSTGTLLAMANTSVTVRLENQDAGIQHSFSVYTNRSAPQAIFRGEPVAGPATKYYTFTTPAAGAYFFRCDVHPDMNGVFSVR